MSGAYGEDGGEWLEVMERSEGFFGGVESKHPLMAVEWRSSSRLIFVRCVRCIGESALLCCWTTTYSVGN